MEGEYTVSTDKKEKIKLDSRIIAANWLSWIAHGGAEAELRVKTAFVADGSTIEIKGYSSMGKAPDAIQGRIYGDEFIGNLLIPEKVKAGADIWFEAKLPKHGLKMESGTTIPAKPPILASEICWDREEVHREDEVLLTCQFESGVVDGEDAVFIIYEHNPNSYDFKVTSFQTLIKNNKAEAKWLFDYHEDTAQIATHKELQPVGKSYINPQYYFMVVVDGMKIGEKRESGLLKFLDWIRIELKDHYGKPIPNEKFTLILSDNSRRNGQLNAEGFAIEEDIPPGVYYTLFPDRM